MFVNRQTPCGLYALDGLGEVWFGLGEENITGIEGVERLEDIGNWLYSRPDRLSRRGSSGSYSNPGGPGSAAVLRALSAAILRCTSSLDDAVATVSAATGLLTGSGFDLDGLLSACPALARNRVLR